MTRLRTNPFFESSEHALPLCYTIMEEVQAVARAKGLTVPDGTVERLIGEARAVGGLGMPSSMMADHFAGRPMETEVILGTPVKEGIRLGVPTPTLLTYVCSGTISTHSLTAVCTPSSERLITVTRILTSRSMGSE